VAKIKLYKMKKLLICLVMALPFALSAQGTSDWKEQNVFHDLMSHTFHPSENGNLKPLKAKADSLVWSAKQWKASAIPSDFKPKETAEQLAKLVKQCAAIQSAGKAKKDDAALTAMIKEAHETFHTVVKECKKSE